MTFAALQKIKRQQIGKLPVVILPLAQWQEVEAILEEYEMMRSLKFRKSVAEARKQIRQGKLCRLDPETGKFRKVQKP
ncbi:MAG: hypothetical protein A3J28_05680 [Acidobacteria bacterium RIFCSPLOWO2_12_FULL_60_22]|nr:MAG: hypothetical protein A3J28_05680 [Acidobacteria bacterium RIFCSPLOWO2_12_FULL_60_22]